VLLRGRKTARINARRIAATKDNRGSTMKTSRYSRGLQAAFIGIAMAGSMTVAVRADIKDYKFELVDQSVQTGPDKIITVRLTNTKTGKAVPDAIIFATRLDMAPDGMQEMVTKVTPMPGTEPGTYRFKVNLSMAGRWQLSLGAKVQGETGTVENKLVVTAQK
jgi:YtkA-like